jgi:cathepsin A (carboxypeptidase C)
MKLLVSTFLASIIAAHYSHGLPFNKEQAPELIEQTHTTVADGEPLICDDVKQYTGYFKLTTGGLLSKNYFYWFFESRNDPVNDPLVLWLTGGPGCSSEVALFGENGPCTTDGSNTTKNPYSWNTKANLLYVDQPTGTGFSYGLGLDHNEAEVAADMYAFLQEFFTSHTQYQKNDFFAFGESYAGHYIPAVTHKIWQNNNNLPTGAITINLKGTSVGNGLTDPEIQYKYYPQMAVSTNDHKPAVSPAVELLMEAAVAPCVDAIKGCQTNASECIIATDLCNLGLMEPYQLTGLNPYDMREKCQVPPLCYDFSNVGKYLKLPEVIDYLGVKGHDWEDCNHAVAIEFELAGDWMHNFQTQIPDQLASDIRVLIYAGDQDYICNWLGNQAWTLAMEWQHKDDFNKASMTNFTPPNGSAPIGQMRSSDGFSFLRIFDAGHMVPRDQPENALAMVNAFLSGAI